MNIRKLEKKDASLMLEWMHDKDVVEFLKADFEEKSIDDCIRFIEQAQDSDENLHLAITDEMDEYVGTVSLKHIKDDNAEFGITVRKSAMGQGFSWYAMTEMLRIAAEKYGLKKVYWCVNPDNLRAIRFYDKHGFSKVTVPDETQGYSDEEKRKYVWYVVNI